MKLKDATRIFGSVGLLLPVLLIFLIAVDASYACPEHTSGVTYRTRVINNRSQMPTTLITYRGPAAYRGCSDSSYMTRRVKYVAVRGNSYYNSLRYVVVRNSDNYYPTRRVRYITARNVDYNDSPRYVVVRRQPAYVDNGMRYVAVRNYAPRTRYMVVRDADMDDVDYDDAPHYAEVRKALYETSPKYVAVRNIDPDYDTPPTRYVALRHVSNACTCADELNSSLDQVETRTPGHEVIKSDYIDGTEDVVYRGEVVNTAYALNNDIDNVAYVEPSVSTNYVAYDDDTMMPQRISYVPASYDDNDFDDQAIVDTDNVTYVADNDIDDACLSSMAYHESPEVVTTRAVSYVPARYVDDDAFTTGSGTTYVAADDTASTVSYVPVMDNDDVDTTYVVADDDASCSCPVALNTSDDVSASTVGYIPFSDVNDIDTEDISYVPVADTGYEAVSYVPADSIDYVDAADISADDCPALKSSVVTEPVEVIDSD